MKTVANLKPGDPIKYGGVTFTVKNVCDGEDGSVTILLEDVPATLENILALRKLQEDTQGMAMMLPVKLENEGWKSSTSRRLAQLTEAGIEKMKEAFALTEEKDSRTYVVTEACPHCGSEIEMRWNTDTQGFKAFCPVCGERLMLCDECRHADYGPCDYDGETDSCQHNPPVANKIPSALRVETPLGAILVRVNEDPDHPGIWIDLRRPDADQDMQLAMVEFCRDEGDRPDGEPNIITRVWGDGEQEDYTCRIVHQRIEDFFKVEEDETLE